MGRVSASVVVDGCIHTPLMENAARFGRSLLKSAFSQQCRKELPSEKKSRE
jgi:hypothetical protein